MYILCNFQLGEKTKDPIIIVTSPKKPITCDLFFFFFLNKHAICFGSGKSVSDNDDVDIVCGGCMWARWGWLGF
jgi:hypothetical protein